MVWSAVIAIVEVGQYVSAWKTIPVILVLLAWTRLLTWVDKDAPAAHLPRMPINLGLTIAGLFGFVLFLFLPSYAAALPALIFVILASFGAYLFMRYQKAGLGDLTGEFQNWLKGLMQKGGVGGEKKITEIKGTVQFLNASGGLMPPPDPESPDLAGFQAAQNILTDPLRRGAEEIDVTPAGEGARVTYIVDGVSFPSEPIDRAGAAAAITYLKTIAKMDVQDKRKPKDGKFKLSLDGQKKELAIHTAGSTAGETMHLLGDVKSRYDRRIDDLGFTDQQLEQVRAAAELKGGIVLVAAPKTQGLHTLLYAVVRAHDAFTSHVQTLERDSRQDLEGITQNKLAPNATAAEEEKQVDWLVSQEPDVIMISSLEDPRAARHLIRHAANGRRAYIGMRAGNTFDALAAWRKLVGDDKLATEHLEMAIAGRLVRRLCSACKIGYVPDPNTLRKLNMDPHRVSKLFQARTDPLRDAKGNPVICEFCKDLRFKGRFGIFEVLVVNDEVRSVVMSGGSSNQLKAAFRQQRGKFLQEAALEKVEAGETSVQEVLRAMKTGDAPAAGGGAGGGGAPPTKPLAPRKPAAPSRPG